MKAMSMEFIGFRLHKIEVLKNDVKNLKDLSILSLSMVKQWNVNAMHKKISEFNKKKYN